MYHFKAWRVSGYLSAIYALLDVGSLQGSIHSNRGTWVYHLAMLTLWSQFQKMLKSRMLPETIHPRVISRFCSQTWASLPHLQ
jgi:hypothetical protein